ncbi:MAG: nucleotidyltransferase family protein [Anaerolineae bacterium]
MPQREMNPNVLIMFEDKRSELEQLCRRYRVRRLSLFGSATNDTFNTSSSDLDFAVEFECLGPDQHKESYFGLLFGLEDLFGRPIDLTEYLAIRNPYFRKALAESELTLYEVA